MGVREYEIVENVFLEEYNLPLKLNSYRHKMWLGKIVDYVPESKFSLKLVWLDKIKRDDGKMYYNISELNEGDFVKARCIKNGKVAIETLIVSKKRENKISFDIISELDVIDVFKNRSNYNIRKMILNNQLPSLSEEDKNKILKEL